jgi:hypothetical protein
VIGNGFGRLAVVLDQTGSTQFLHVVVHHRNRERTDFRQFSLCYMIADGQLPEYVQVIQPGRLEVETLVVFCLHCIQSFNGFQLSELGTETQISFLIVENDWDLYGSVIGGKCGEMRPYGEFIQYV